MLLILILASVSIAAAQVAKIPADFSAKVAALEGARLAHPNDLQILDALAGSYAMAAEYRKAIAVIQQMRTLHPEDRSLELRLARNYAWAGDIRRAIAEYSSYLGAARDDRQAAMELLSERQQRIIQLSLEGWSVHDIASELKTGPERVSDEKYKAIRKLREYLAS